MQLLLNGQKVLLADTQILVDDATNNYLDMHGNAVSKYLICDIIDTPDISVPADFAPARYLYIDGTLVLNGEYPVPPAPPEPDHAQVDPLTELQEENRQLHAKVSALVESNGMLEECVVELAQLVYA